MPYSLISLFVLAGVGEFGELQHGFNRITGTTSSTMSILIWFYYREMPRKRGICTMQ